MLYRCLQPQTLLLSHLDEASGRQGVHEGMAPGILLQHVRDEPHRSGIHLLQPDADKTAGGHQHTPLNPSGFAWRRVEKPSSFQRAFKGFICGSPPVRTRSRRGRWAAGRPAAAER